MKGLKEKLRLIFLPYLLIAVGFFAVYSLLRWALFIKNDFFAFQEDVIKFWLPFALPWIPVFIWLRPRIKLLRFKSDNGSFGFQFIVAMAIAFPTIVAQQYLDSATGKLTPLQNISQYKQQPVTKYYSLHIHFVDTTHLGIYRKRSVSGKHNEKLNLSVFVVMPLLDDRSGIIKGDDFYYIGVKYSETISNKLSAEETQEKIDAFAAQTRSEFDITNFQRFVYLERLGHTDDHKEFNRAINKSVLGWGKDPVVFTAHDESFDKRNGSKLGWIFKSFGIGSLVVFLFIFFLKLQEGSLATFKSGSTTKDSSLRETFGLLIPKEGYFVTPIIIHLNLIIFLFMIFSGLGVISFTAADLLQWGGNYRPYTINGQWWRLLTNIFLHGGLMHVVANMVALLFVGIFLEPIMGRTRYAVVYLLTGVIASVASIWWHPGTVSVGASGAIFGLYGVFLALLLLKVFPAGLSKAFLFSTIFFIGYNLLMGLTSGIDNAAHVGGLASGFIIGLLLSPSLKARMAEEEVEL